MAAPNNLNPGDSFWDGNIRYKVVTVVTPPNGYDLEIIETRPFRFLTYAELSSATESVVIVQDPSRPEDEGVWARINGVYRKQELKKDP